MDASKWEMILPRIIHKAFNTSSAIIGYLDMIERTADPAKQKKYRFEAKKGVSEIETVFLELGYLIEKYSFDIEPSPFSPYQIVSEILTEYDKVDFYPENREIIVADFEVFRLFIDLLLRIIDHNLIPPAKGKLTLHKGQIELDADFACGLPWSDMEGKWGYEMELLGKVIDIIGIETEITDNKISFRLVGDEQT